MWPAARNTSYTIPISLAHHTHASLHAGDAVWGRTHTPPRPQHGRTHAHRPAARAENHHRGSRRGIATRAAARWPASRCTPPSRERWVSRPTHQRQPSHAFAIIALARLEVYRRSPKPIVRPPLCAPPPDWPPVWWPAGTQCCRAHQLPATTTQPRAAPRSSTSTQIRLCEISCPYRPARAAISAHAACRCPHAPAHLRD